MSTNVLHQEMEFPPAVQAAALAAMPLPDQARALRVTTHEEFEAASAFLREVKARRKAIDEAFAPVIAAGLQAHRQALALKKRADGPCEDAERIVKPVLATYDMEQTCLRREAERQAAADRRRRAADVAAATARHQQDAEAAADRDRFAAAEAALDAGDDAKAERILAHPAAVVVPVPPAPLVPPPVDAPVAPKAAGVSFRQVHRWRLVDAAAVTRTYLTVDEKKINSVVRALGHDAVATVGGIEVYTEAIVAARS